MVVTISTKDACSGSFIPMHHMYQPHRMLSASTMNQVSHSNRGMYQYHQPMYSPYSPRRSYAPATMHPPSNIMPPSNYDTQRFHMYQTKTPVSPTNTAEEVEAAAALISLPSSGSNSPSFRPIEAPMTTNYYHNPTPICQPTLPSHPSDSVENTFIPTFPRNHHVIPFASDTSSVASNDDSLPLQCMPVNSQDWYSGSTSLSLPQDDNVLSPLHCFLRKYCVEAFSATSQDIAIPRYGKSHGGKIVLHQVGIRCLHCKHLELKPDRAVCYPSSLRNIYHSIETWQRRHAPVCHAIPSWIKRELTRLIETSRTMAGGRRQYWQDAAEQLGMVDTCHGVRFARPPGLVEGMTVNDATLVQDGTPSTPLVTNEDKSMVTDFLFLLMRQMETCHFSEEDRTGGRSKVKNYPVGFGGMQCKHCRGMAGFGRYFPSSINALSLANSDRNIYNHLKKCRKCPESTKEELRRLQAQESVKNKRGSRKKFFRQVWNRIHHVQA